MKNVKTIVVVGGGYAGINLIESLKKEFHIELKKHIRIVLVDKNPFHFKKVKLFKGIVNEDVTDLFVPLNHYCGSMIEFIEGELRTVNADNQTVNIAREGGELMLLEYDQLVLALGSVVREVHSDCGGISLSNLDSAQRIRQHLLGMLGSSRHTIRLVIAGSGITGIETAAEVSAWLKEETKKAGFKHENVEVFLINHKQRLLMEAPLKVSERLEQRLINRGITVIHNKKAEKFLNGKVYFSDKTILEVDACIWTVGLQPHPTLINIGLPLNEEGKINVDSRYRLADSENIYAIGDCVHVVDPTSGKAAAMSCKEAISQAQRLAKIMRAQIQGHHSAAHQNYPDFLCIGLGPNDSFVLAQKWGMDFAFSGKLAQKIREYTWNVGSIVH
ncbi:NAD(P)/FAD-dependent oxidoreductase [Bacillus sp. T33-2]|uniref:NAD(P)/FAD-dependent oxidoreductase n=1 Tax=Bacillus sp. T33-2 TaxID=2054168 RepID=UPI000C76599A|nr:FAD-dependent oxidoreductase [Bacillus sp. T33-2]PLR95282.1 hypothetical protein CVD19_15045 [Bacillus sp. T33-2]